MPPPSTPRFYSLDGIRGIASILVVMRHTIPFFGVSFQESYLAVDIFFLLSGVVISNAYERRLQTGLSTLQFAWVRVARIYPLYIFGTAISLAAISLGTFPIVIHDLLPTVVLAALGMPDLRPGAAGALYPLDGPAWSLFYELAVNIAYAMTLRFLTIRSLFAILFASAAGLVVGLNLWPEHNLGDYGWVRGTLLLGFFRVTYSFFAGVLLFRLFAATRRASISGLHGTLVAWMVLTLTFGLLAAAPQKSIQDRFDLVAVTLAFPAIICVGLWVQPAGISARVCKFLGEISYALYAIHVPLMFLVLPSVLGSNMPPGADSRFSLPPWSSAGCWTDSTMLPCACPCSPCGPSSLKAKSRLETWEHSHGLIRQW